MSVISISPPYPSFNRADGQPLDAGKVYIGTAFLNPLVDANQIAVYSDEALTIPVAQPIRTNGGFPVINGRACRIYAASDDYSIVVLDKDGSLVYSSFSNKTKLGLIDLSTDVTGLLTSTSIKYDITLFEQAAGVTPVNYYYEPGNVLRYGADREGVNDSTQAFEDCIKACVYGILWAGVRRIRMVIPAGLYRLNPAGADGLLFEEALYGGGFEVAGEGEQNTVLLFENTSGPCITIKGNLFDFHDFTVDADTGRQGGSGDGVVINAGLSTTSYRGRLARIAIKNQPTDGLACTRIEHHKFDEVWVYNSGRYGFNLQGGPGQFSWNLFLNCRSQVSGSHGWVLDNVVTQNTFINAEALSFGKTYNLAAGFVVNGRDNIFINPDSENFEHIDNTTAYTGFQITGTGHVIERGYIGDVQYPIRLVSANRCGIRYPTITAGRTGIGGTNAIESDVASVANEYHVRQAYTGYTNPIFPVEGRNRDIINFDGQYFGRMGTWTPDLRIGGSATGIAYSDRTGKWRAIGDLIYLEFDITLSNKGASAGALTILGLPFAAATGSRGKVEAAIISNGASVTNLAASAVTPGASSINLRSQGLTGMSDLTDANLTNSTRIIGSVVYLRST
jgi:hypothetical protein